MAIVLSSQQKREKHFPTEDQNEKKFDKHISKKNQIRTRFLNQESYDRFGFKRFNRDYYCLLENESIAIAPNVPAIIVHLRWDCSIRD